VSALTGDFYYQSTWKVGVDPRDDPSAVAKRRLQSWTIDTRAADQAEKPSLESALATCVDQSVEQTSSTVDPRSVLANNTRAQSLPGNQSQSDR
jgi:hypothetical protein